jgi:hypothetical protein
MVACVPLARQPERCFDLTIPAIDSETLPPSLWGAIRLDLKPDTTRPTLFDVPADGWAAEYAVERDVAHDGKVLENGKKTYSGAAAAVLRGALGPLSEVERQGWLRREFRSMFGMDLDPQMVSSGLDDAAGPVTVQWSVAYPDGQRVDMAGEIRWRETPLVALTDQLVCRNEHHPYPVTGTHAVVRVRYRLPLGYAVDQVGATLAFESHYGNLSRSYRIDADRRSVVATTDLHVSDALIRRDSIRAFNRFMGEIDDESRPWFSVIRP